MPPDVYDTWVTGALGFTIPSSPDGKPGGADHSQLLARWAAAQTQARDAVVGVGSAVLALDEVKADPRFEQVKSAVGKLPDMLPSFGDQIETALGASADGAAGLSAVASCRQILAGAKSLGEIERFASKHVGEIGVAAMLDSALAEIESRLQAAA